MAHSHPVVKVAAFSAHDGPVRCANLGAKSGQLLVTGGDDGHCNIWWLGRAARLAGFDAKSPVVAATFDRTEGCVAAGSLAGSVKLWDLERAGADPSPTLALASAHRSAVTAIAFHTVNERLLVTGGADGAVRLWDRRSSGEFTRFGGHSGGISVIKTLPHGRALIAGTTEGKLLVSGVAFIVGRMFEFFQLAGAAHQTGDAIRAFHSLLCSSSTSLLVACHASCLRIAAP